MTPEQRQRLSDAHKGKLSGRKGTFTSEESRKKMSASQKKRFEKNKPWNKNIPMTEETRKKLSESQKKRMANPELRKRVSEFFKGRTPWIKGKHHSDETRKRLSFNHLGLKYPNRKHVYSRTSFQKGHKINLGRHFSEEFGKKIVETRRKNNSYKFSEETRKKLSESQKKRMANPELKKRMSLSQKKRFSSPEEIRRAIERRAKQVFPIKDTKIEVKIQNFLKQLKIEFVTHKYMQIEHAYQCDIFVPSLNLIIECDGDRYHFNPKKFKKDDKIYKDTPLKKAMTAEEKWKLDANRTREMEEKGLKVLRLWESEISKMNLEDFRERINTFLRG